MVIFEKFGTNCLQTLTYDRLIVFLKVGTSRELSLGNGYVILNMLLIQGSQMCCLKGFLWLLQTWCYGFRKLRPMCCSVFTLCNVHKLLHCLFYGWVFVFFINLKFILLNMDFVISLYVMFDTLWAGLWPHYWYVDVTNVCFHSYWSFECIICFCFTFQSSDK